MFFHLVIVGSGLMRIETTQAAFYLVNAHKEEWLNFTDWHRMLHGFLVLLHINTGNCEPGWAHYTHGWCQSGLVEHGRTAGEDFYSGADENCVFAPLLPVQMFINGKISSSRKSDQSRCGVYSEEEMVRVINEVRRNNVFGTVCAVFTEIVAARLICVCYCERRVLFYEDWVGLRGVVSSYRLRVMLHLSSTTLQIDNPYQATTPSVQTGT